MSDDAPITDAERRRLEERYAEIAALAGGLAHEIRNPLSTISLNLELMAEDLDAESAPRDGRLLRRVETVRSECRHLEEILNAFLKFARPGELTLEPANLNQHVQSFVDFYQPQAAECRVDVSPHLAPDLPAVRLDASLFRQVLMNLALNAQQALPDGGLLELQTHRDGKHVVLDVIDNGAGMDAGTCSRIFDAFFSTRPGGSGLGLPTVRKIIEAHDGSIDCHSEPGRGTRFRISLPAVRDG